MPTGRVERALRICLRVLAIAALLASLKRDLSYDLHPNKHLRPYDFRATYCGAYVTVRHGNPYAAAPLRRCEASLLKKSDLPLPNQALPATLPPYGQVLFSPLGFLDSLNAQRAFYALSFGALLASIWAISRLSGLSWEVVTIPLVFGLYAPASRLGAVAVFAFTGVAFTAYFYQRGRYAACAVAFCVAMLQPQTGLAIWVALLLKQPRMRVPLLLAAVALAALCLPLGIERSVEYLQSLRIHSIAEEYQNTQLSLTYLLRHVGLSEQGAAMWGSVAYLLWLVCGAAYVRMRPETDAFDVLLPATIAVLPGSFVQTIYLATALIPALMLLRNRASLRAFLGMALIATAWQPILRPAGDTYLALSLLGTSVLIALLFPMRRSGWLIPVWLIGVLGYCAFGMLPLPFEHPVPAARSEPAFASAEWYAYRVAQPGPTPDVWVRKLPYVAGLLLILTAALAKGRRGQCPPPGVLDAGCEPLLG